MNMKEIKELLDLVVDKGFTEFELERSGMRLRVKRDLGHAGGSSKDPSALSSGPVISYAPIVASLPASAVSQQPAIAAAPAPGAPPAAPAIDANLYTVKSPIVGTFYGSPSPEAPPFVKPGDVVAAGQTLCIIEAMKLMNEIESDVAGEIVDRLVQSGQPVEYGQPLFAIRRPLT